jgi:hypothetical protein
MESCVIFLLLNFLSTISVSRSPHSPGVHINTEELGNVFIMMHSRMICENICADLELCMVEKEGISFLIRDTGFYFLWM